MTDRGFCVVVGLLQTALCSYVVRRLSRRMRACVFVLMYSDSG